jgi:hypothetical protein
VRLSVCRVCISDLISTTPMSFQFIDSLQPHRSGDLKSEQMSPAQLKVFGLRCTPESTLGELACR